MLDYTGTFATFCEGTCFSNSHRVNDKAKKNNVDENRHQVIEMITLFVSKTTTNVPTFCLISFFCDNICLFYFFQNIGSAILGLYYGVCNTTLSYTYRFQTRVSRPLYEAFSANVDFPMFHRSLVFLNQLPGAKL